MINIRMQHKDVKRQTPVIKVAGVGGGGNNAVNNMIAGGAQGVDFIVCNTDSQALDGSLCEIKVQLGEAVTGGLGAGAKPEVGRKAAEESIENVMQYLDDANMVFITAGMGGGTGTGAAPVIAKACRERGILTVGVVTKPFNFEGTLRMRMAEAGIREMQDYVDTLIVIPNQNLFRIANEKTTFAEAFRLADSVLQSAVRGVTDLMVMPGHINLDFADIRSAMLEQGKAMMGTGEASGEGRAIKAAQAAINNPLLDDVSMKGARGVIINVTGGYDLTLFEVDEACNLVRDEVDPNANIIVGSTFDESLSGTIRVSVVATGIDAVEEKNIKRVPGGVTITSVGAGFGERQPVIPPTAHTSAHQPLYTEAARTIASGANAYSMTRTQAETVDIAVQQEFAIDSVKKPAAPVEPQVQVAQAQPVQAEGGARAVVHGNAFIPPRPVEVDANTRRGESYNTSPGGFGNLAASRRAAEEANAAPGLALRPPVPGATQQNAARKRTPSLFDRITNRHQAGEEQAEIVQAPVELPSRRPEPTDDELDIPAFLRRQAN